ncbi:MAG TPA: thioesterase family protein [Phycisphaerae bacterium]|nr:thioesterase family protein [Phycisphaerae bacterium]
MPAIHTYHVTVSSTAIDANGHANNVEYLRWFQDGAISHADAAGCTAATLAIGASWVVRSHQITYLRPAFEGDRLIVKTWVATFEKVSSIRRYQILRPSDNAVLAEGETNWIFIDAPSGRPRRIPPEIAGLFTLHPSGAP